LRPRADAQDLLTTRFDELIGSCARERSSEALRFSNESMEKRRVSRDILSTLLRPLFFSALVAVAGVLLHFRTRFVDALSGVAAL
jgi:hypothetical protein